jgi:hypothetical protein
MSDKTLKQKSDYVTDLINSQNGLKSENTLAYSYLYDITKFLCRRKFKSINCSSSTEEEVVQNIVVQLFFFFEKKKIVKIDSIFPYVDQCILSEICKIRTDKYEGASLEGIVDPKITRRGGDNLIYFPISEVEYDMYIYKQVIKIIEKVIELLNEIVIPVEHKHLVLFPLVLAIAREDEKLLKLFKFRTKEALKMIYHNIGSMSDRLK